MLTFATLKNPRLTGKILVEGRIVTVNQPLSQVTGATAAHVVADVRASAELNRARADTDLIGADQKTMKHAGQWSAKELADHLAEMFGVKPTNGEATGPRAEVVDALAGNGRKGK